MISVKCPSCGIPVYGVSEKITTTVSCKCKKCDRLVSYNGTTKEIRLLGKPQRYSSSGVRFY